MVFTVFVTVCYCLLNVIMNGVLVFVTVRYCLLNAIMNGVLVFVTVRYCLLNAIMNGVYSVRHCPLLFTECDNIWYLQCSSLSATVN